MTEYVKSTNFTSKDSLATGNPLKIVKGTEIDAEFNNIAIAVATKADLISPAFVGIPTAPTATYGNSTTQLATTAFVTAALQLIYPVGSIYTNASSATNPSTLIGFGTWSIFGEGKVLVGLNVSDASFSTLGGTGGSKASVVVGHSHTLTAGSTAAAGAHDHYVGSTDSTANTGGNATQEFIRSYNGGDGPTALTSPVGTHTHTLTGSTDTTGVSGTNANLQPYVVVNMWLRTA